MPEITGNYIILEDALRLASADVHSHALTVGSSGLFGRVLKHFVGPNNPRSYCSLQQLQTEVSKEFL